MSGGRVAGRLRGAVCGRVYVCVLVLVLVYLCPSGLMPVIACACAWACFCVPRGSVTVCAVLKDGVYFTTEGSTGLKALSKRLKEAEAAYETKQVPLWVVAC